jgi:predicted transcriptional regulator
MVEDRAGMKKVSFYLDADLHKSMDEIARSRGESSVSGVLREAVAKYVDAVKKGEPANIKDQIRQVLVEDPTLRAEILKGIGLQFVFRE